MSRRLLAIAFIALCSIWCGIATGLTKQNQCYTCRGINCQRTTAQNVTESCIYDLDVCVTIFKKFTVEAKGCLLNIPVELRSKCNDKTDPECQICNGNLCNNFGRRDFKCYECTTEGDDSNCARNVSALTPVQCKIPSAPNSYCYTAKTNNQGVQRGCSLHVKDQKACLDSQSCILCSVEHGQGCNTINIDEMSGGRGNAAVIMLVLGASLARMILMS